MAAPSQFFPAIGSVVEDASNDQPNEAARPADGEEDERAVQEIESLCMNCHEQGVTRLLLTSIPYFKEVIIASFRCEHCGTSNNEIQSAGEIRPEGTVYTARVLTRSDLDRQLVKSANCTVQIPEFELTMPPGRGQLTTVEGLVRDIVADLSADQPVRKHIDPATHAKLQRIIDGLSSVLADSADDAFEADAGGSVVHRGKEAGPETPVTPFTVKLDDPSGNSFIEFIGSTSDPKWNLRTYKRTRQHNIELGLAAPDDEPQPGRVATIKEGEEGEEPAEKANEEIFVFSGVCSSCGHPLDTLMKKVVIPYFKDILIMSTNCDKCGYRDNEVKSGSAISAQGKRITLKVEDSEDLSRDILKSETCGLTIPEIDLALHAGTLGGRFTTLEGILNQVYEELSERVFSTGDSSSSDDRSAFSTFLAKLKSVKSAERPFTLILDDPLANSYLQNLYAPDPDPNMVIETYDRTFDENEELGLNDMKVEGYEEDAKGVEGEGAEKARADSVPSSS